MAIWTIIVDGYIPFGVASRNRKIDTTGGSEISDGENGEMESEAVGNLFAVAVAADRGILA